MALLSFTGRLLNSLRANQESQIDEMVLRLTKEIAELTRQQVEALRSTTSLGMTTNDAHQFDARRQQIGTMLETLQRLKRTK